MRKHIRNVHTNKPTACKVCGKVFRNISLVQVLIFILYLKSNFFIKIIIFRPTCCTTKKRSESTSAQCAQINHPGGLQSLSSVTRKLIMVSVPAFNVIYATPITSKLPFELFPQSCSQLQTFSAFRSKTGLTTHKTQAHGIGQARIQRPILHHSFTNQTFSMT